MNHVSMIVVCFALIVSTISSGIFQELFTRIELIIPLNTAHVQILTTQQFLRPPVHGDIESTLHRMLLAPVTLQ